MLSQKLSLVAVLIAAVVVLSIGAYVYKWIADPHFTAKRSLAGIWQVSGHPRDYLIFYASPFSKESFEEVNEFPPHEPTIGRPFLVSSTTPYRFTASNTIESGRDTFRVVSLDQHKGELTLERTSENGNPFSYKLNRISRNPMDMPIQVKKDLIEARRNQAKIRMGQDPDG